MAVSKVLATERGFLLPDMLTANRNSLQRGEMQGGGLECDTKHLAAQSTILAPPYGQFLLFLFLFIYYYSCILFSKDVRIQD